LRNVVDTDERPGASGAFGVTIAQGNDEDGSMTIDRAVVLSGIPEELLSFEELIGSLNSGDLGAPSRCADWTVADVIGHVVGTIVDITEGRLEGQGTEAVTQRQAQERVGRSVQELKDELAAAAPVLVELLASLPEEIWDEPAPNNPDFPLGFAVEALWYDTYLHGDDVRNALVRPSLRGEGLRCAVHHVAGYLEYKHWASVTLALSGVEKIDIGGGGPEITGDALEFVLAATGRRDPTELGLDPSINVYPNQNG
jgi:uncharacterized protein (TIGR03083 family)